MATPAGALTPLDAATNAGIEGRSSYIVRAARWAFPSRAANTSFAASLQRRGRGSGVVAATLGYFRPGCDCPGVFMAGVDASASGWNRSFADLARAELGSTIGFGLGRDADQTYGSIAIGVPASLSRYAMGGHRFSLFATPRLGIGFADSRVGPTLIVGGGASWTSRGGRGIQLGVNRVLLTGTASTLGASVVWR